MASLPGNFDKVQATRRRGVWRDWASIVGDDEVVTLGDFADSDGEENTPRRK